VILKTSQTSRILEYQTWAPGTYTIPIQPNGNSILSSVLVTDVGAAGTVKVNYYQTTAANEQIERSELVGHPLISTAINSARQTLVTKIHSKIFAEVIISGNDVECGLIVTVISSFASDLDSALKFDQQVFNDLGDKGIPIVGLDDTTGLFNMIRTRNGLLGVTSEVGAPWFEVESFSHTWTANQSRDLLEFTVSGGVSRTVNTVYISTFLDGIARLYFGSDLVGFARTMAGAPNGIIRLNPGQVAEELVEVKVTFEACEDSAGSVLVDVAVYGSELNI
jgi:hypothetical protein